jgi:uncharacterized protein
MSVPQPKSPWYRDGLAFTCTRCGDCCTGAPGYVWVTIEEMRRIAEFRGETVEAFAERFVRLVEDRFSLIEKPGGDCIFWDKQAGCTVYSARPDQCRAWPFWPENLTRRKTWERVCQVCPGAGRGQVHTLNEIQISLATVEK